MELILFILFIASLFKLFHGKKNQPDVTIQGYFDIKPLTARVQKQELGARMIESAFVKVEKWAEENSIIFDFDKFEAIHFSRKKVFPNPDIKLLSLYCQYTIF